MLVTILTVVYNGATTIGRTIESVMNQTYDDIEYIIIDGASGDNTVDIAESYEDEFLERKGRKLTIISEPDKGMYDGLNKGAKMAHGELVGQINSDDWYEPNAVEIMVNLYKRKQYDVAWGSILIRKRSGDMIKHAKMGKIWSTSHWCHPAMFSRREILLLFPYALESMYDDFDFITNVKQHEKKIDTLDYVITNFTFGGMSTKKSLVDAKRRVGITYRIYKKYGMSKFYYVERWIVELGKYFLG